MVAPQIPHNALFRDTALPKKNKKTGRMEGKESNYKKNKKEEKRRARGKDSQYKHTHNTQRGETRVRRNNTVKKIADVTYNSQS